MMTDDDRALLALRQQEAKAGTKAKAHADATVKANTRHSIGYHSAKAQKALLVAGRRGKLAKLRESGR